MRLSKKSDYALRALVDLALHAGQGPQPLRELAARNDIPKRFLEQIAIEMRQQQWIESVAGRDGGYRLAKPTAQITMGEVVRFFDGVLSPIGCVSAHHYEACSQEATCRFRRVMLLVRNYTAALMEKTTLADLVQGTPVTRAEVFEDRLVGGAGI